MISLLLKLGFGLVWFGLVYGVQRHFQQYLSYNVPVSFIGGGNQSTQRKPPTFRKLLKNYKDVSSTLRLSGNRTHNIS